MSKTYLAMERRYNYTTPKTFLEQIKLYQNLLSKKRSELTAKIERLEKGLMKLQSTTSQVPAHSIAPAVGLTQGARGGRPHRVVMVATRSPSHTEPPLRGRAELGRINPLICSVSPPTSRWMI